MTETRYEGDAKKRERQRIVVALERDMERAYARREPWYMWVLWRHEGEHHHDLTRDDGSLVACPVAGCRAV